MTIGLTHNRILASLREAYRHSKSTPVWLYLIMAGPTSLVLAVVFLQPYVDPSWLLRDPATVAYEFGVPDHAPIYYGFVSNLGILLWCAAASVCLLVGLWLAVEVGELRAGAFLLISGFLSCVLLLDDVFLVHELVFPYLTKLSGTYLIVFYVVLFATYSAAFWRNLLGQRTMLFAIALAMFATSIVSDIFLVDVHDASRWEWLLEDGSKFLGIAAWTTFYWCAAWDALHAARAAASRR